MLVPQGMAYALLAGLPPIAGLYAAMVPLLVYPIFGTSRHLSVGPVAMDSLLVAAGVGVMATTGSEQYWSLAILLALLVGTMQFLMGILQLGFLVNFLSQPLISGFTSAAAIIISLSQVKHLVGIEIPGSQQVISVLSATFDQISNTHLSTLLVGLGCIVLLVSLSVFKPKWPAALIAVAISIAIVYTFRLDLEGVKIVGDVPKGFPPFNFPELDWNQVLSLLTIAFTISIISFMEGIAIAKKFATNDGFRVDANKELRAIGLANFSAGLFSGYPIAGSFSRTAINKNSGAKTPLSSVFNALVIALTLGFLTPVFYYMPNAALAAVVIVAVLKLVDIKEPRRLYSVKKEDFLILVSSFLLTLLLGARLGILIGAIASIVLVIRRISYPKTAILGQIKGTSAFRNIKIEKKARQVSGVILFRIDASLYYANSVYLKDKIQQTIAHSKSDIHSFVIDASSINEIDSTALTMLLEIREELLKKEIQLYFTNAKYPVRRILENTGFTEILGRDHFFLTNEDALEKLGGPATELE